MQARLFSYQLILFLKSFEIYWSHGDEDYLYDNSLYTLWYVQMQSLVKGLVMDMVFSFEYSGIVIYMTFILPLSSNKIISHWKSRGCICVVS